MQEWEDDSFDRAQWERWVDNVGDYMDDGGVNAVDDGTPLTTDAEFAEAARERYEQIEKEGWPDWRDYSREEHFEFIDKFKRAFQMERARRRRHE